MIAFAALAGWVAFTAALAWLAYGLAMDKKVGWSDWLLLVVLGTVGFFASIGMVEGLVKRLSRPKSLLEPAPIIGLYSASIVSFGFWVGMIALFDPTTVSQLSELGNKVDAMRPVPAPSPQSRILMHIAGRWGVPPCEEVLEIELKARALILDGIRRDTGERLSHQVATIRYPLNADPDVLDTTDAHGDAASFTYFDNGVERRLRWDDLKSPAKDFMPC